MPVKGLLTSEAGWATAVAVAPPIVAASLKDLELLTESADLRKQLFLLYQLGIINLLHPGTTPGDY